MNEQYYLDKSTLVFDGTLIRMRCEGTSVTIPSSFGDQKVMTAGSGALVLDDVQELSFAPGFITLKRACLGYHIFELEHVIIPETVESVDEQLFLSGVTRDVQLTIDRAFSPALFQSIRSASAATGGKGRLLLFPALQGKDMEPVRCLMKNLAAPAAVRKEMRTLFVSRSTKKYNQLYTGTIFEPRPCFDLVSGRGEREEYTVIMEMIRGDDTGWLDPPSEARNDLLIRQGKKSVSNYRDLEVALGICEPIPDTFGSDGMYHVRINISRHELFFPTLHRIRHRGSDWWIYSRNYLTSQTGLGYKREDVCVFDRNGLVTDRGTSNDVYAKYRFLTML